MITESKFLIPIPGEGILTNNPFNGRTLYNGTTEYIWASEEGHKFHYQIIKMSGIDIPHWITSPRNIGNERFYPISNSHYQTAYNVGYNLAYNENVSLAIILSFGGTPGVLEMGDSYGAHFMNGIRMGVFDRKWGFGNWVTYNFN